MHDKKYIIDGNASLKEALTQLNKLPGNAMTLFVIDRGGQLQGTLTDGDVRRAIIAGSTLDSPVSDAMHREFRSVGEAMSGIEKVDVLRACRRQGIMLVPELDADGRLVDIIDLNLTPTHLPVSAVLMAGGKGERLRPLTDNTPKPLLEIDGKAIIDYNVEALASCGITDITVATGHMADKIIDHFRHPVAGVHVKHVREDKPLGTAGALSLIKHKPGGTTLVMNSDLLTTIDFEEMFINHIYTGAAISIAVIPYQVSVPYAIVATDGNTVTAIEEKPSYSYFANAGIYMISNDILNIMPHKVRIDATELIEAAIKGGRKVVHYPIKGTWIDIGSPIDFRHAAELMRHHRTFRNNSN